MTILSVSTTISAVSAIYGQPQEFVAGNLAISIGNEGQIVSIYNINQNKQYFPEGQSAHLLSIVVGDKIERPKGMSFDDASSLISLSYGDTGVIAQIRIFVKPSHITFELESVEGANPALVMWGPFPTSISQTIGETVGVVQDDKFAFGIQALNIHTIGGRPPEYLDLGVGSESNAASPSDYGSVVQAYSRESNGGIKGSKIALFGCKPDQALNTIEKIEIAESLPHPVLDGVWGKISPTARLCYLISSFGEHDLDDLLPYAHNAGLKYIYHEGPFKTWGHFQLNPDQFPDGDESMKRCVQKAESAGVRIGVHTLTNFITTNDPYVSPIPDPRLMKVGSSNLIDDIDDKVTDIRVADKSPFLEKQWLSTAIIDSELIQYASISDSEPFMLMDCKRGAFGTNPSAHRAGAEIGKLHDHPYRVFFPNLEMQEELTARLVELFNRTGLRQISFDGLEGCLATGHGFYAENLFVKQCFDGWKQEVINDASGLSHYLWHIHTRMNWGEPWGKAMREGMAEYRFKNQDYFNRNLFPRMLGWFLVRTAEGDLEATTLDDVEWVMAKCAGYDAGCAIVASINTLKTNGHTDIMLGAIREWEKARLGGAFSDEQRHQIMDVKNEFHLEPTNDGKWKLYPVDFSSKFSYRWEERQPGQPSCLICEIQNRFSRQPLRFTLRVVPTGNLETSSIGNPSFESNARKVTFPVKLKPQQYLVCEGGGDAFVYDQNWNLIQIVRADSDIPNIYGSAQHVEFGCEFFGNPKPFVELRFKTMGEPELAGD